MGDSQSSCNSCCHVNDDMSVSAYSLNKSFKEKIQKGYEIIEDKKIDFNEKYNTPVSNFYLKIQAKILKDGTVFIMKNNSGVEILLESTTGK